MPIGRFIFWLACAALLIGCREEAAPLPAAPGTPLVRVLIIENKPQVSLSASASPSIRAGSASPHRLDFDSGGSAPLTLSPSGWRLGGLSFPRGELTLVPAAQGSVRIDGEAYRGQFRFVPAGPDRFDVVNDLDIEGYLKGVLPRELFRTWHEETYKAQAIVARTYALYEARTGGIGRSFDLYTDQRSQMYAGLSAESAIGDAAVDGTRGVVVAYGPRGRERIFKAYFSSCCGGITQSAADAFGDPPTPPLSDQLIGPRCAASPHFNWGPVVIAKAELSRRLRAWGAEHNHPERNMGDVARVDVQFINRWGRPVRFVVTDSKGTRYSIAGEDFRQAFNTDAANGVTVFSSFFKPVTEATDIRLIDGHGFGHGVGLCQWCAEAEASNGVAAEQIVVSAYPGSVLVRAY